MGWREVGLFVAAMVGLGVLSGVVLATAVGTFAGLLWVAGALP